jgi:predicted O-methyltransferase YrrM
LRFTSGTTTEVERKLLRDLVAESDGDSGPIVEIGTLFGSTTITLALAVRNDRKVVTVDCYAWNPLSIPPASHFALTAQILRFPVELGLVDHVRMDKAKFYQEYSMPPPSLVFLDAVHNYAETKLDIEWALAANAGIIAGHDYCDLWPGVREAVDEFGGPMRLGGSVWVLDRNKAVARQSQGKSA